MSLIPEGAGPAGGIYQECVQELQKPHRDYAKVQALATLSLVEALQEVTRQMADLSHQIRFASRR
jgi:hypothetical protein